MKKFTALILSLCMLLSLCACGDSPADKVAKYVEKNGTISNGVTRIVYDKVEEMILSNDGSINLDTANSTSRGYLKILNDGAGVYFELVNQEDNAVFSATRTLKINIDGTFVYTNSLVIADQDITMAIDGVVEPATYDKSEMPTIVEARLVDGATLTDGVKEGMKNSVDLALDCVSVFLRDEMGLSLADIGFTSYIAE